MRSFCYILIAFTLLSLQLACTNQEGFNSNGRGFAGYAEPAPVPPSEKKIANFSNSKSKCTLKDIGASKQSLSCLVYVVEANGAESIATEVAAGVTFSWGMHSPTNIDLASISTCNVSNDTLSYSCELNCSTLQADVDANVILSVTDKENEQPKSISEPIKIEVVVAVVTPTPSPVVVTDPFSSNVGLLLKMIGANGDPVTDSKSKSVSSTGVSIAAPGGKFGTGSAQFSGSEYLTIPYSSDFNFGNGDFTVEMYVNFSSVTYYNRILGRWSGHIAAGWLFAQEANMWAFYWKTGVSGSGQESITYTPPVPTQPNTWYHIAVSRSGSTIRMFLDGVLVANQPIASSLTESTEDLCVGGHKPGVSEFAGNLNYVRITKGVGRYSADFTPPIASSF